MDYSHLKEKGWNLAEISRVKLASAHSEQYDKHFSKIVFWSALLVIIFANLIVSLMLIPVLVALTDVLLYATVIVLGGTIGFLYHFLIRDIGHLERKHHLLAGIIIPLLALANLALVVLWSNTFIGDLGLQNQAHNAWLLGLVFAAAFSIPAAVGGIRKNLIYP
ncbi:MAG: hypothetical protein AABX13_06185 [Nanoarchaeota archaeon]